MTAVARHDLDADLLADLQREVVSLRHQLALVSEARDVGWREVGRLMDESRLVNGFGGRGPTCRR